MNIYPSIHPSCMAANIMTKYTGRDGIYFYGCPFGFHSQNRIYFGHSVKVRNHQQIPLVRAMLNISQNLLEFDVTFFLTWGFNQKCDIYRF